MKLGSAIEGGLAGVTTLSLLGETLRKIDGKPNGISSKRVKKRLKKAGSKKKPMKAAQQYIQLAGDVLGAASLLGFSSFGKKKNAVLRGAMLGAAAGLGAVLLNDRQHDDHTDRLNGHEGFQSTMTATDTTLQKAMEVALFTLGGMLAGKMIKGAGKKKRKK